MKPSDFINALQRAQAPLKNKVQLMIGRAIIAAAKDDGKINSLQIKALAGESFDQIRRFQDFGFTSMPPVGTEAVILAMGGNRENLVVVATDHRASRTTGLLPGESAIYTDDGTVMKFKKSGNVELTTATKVLITCPLSEITGNVKIGGTLEVTGATTLKDTLQVQKAATFLKAVSMAETLAVTGAATFTAAVTIGGAIAAQAIGAASLVASGIVSAAGVSIADIKTLYNSHVHPENNGTGSPNTNTTPQVIP